MGPWDRRGAKLVRPDDVSSYGCAARASAEAVEALLGIGRIAGTDVEQTARKLKASGVMDCGEKAA